jgi:hypothetical protein
MTSKSEHILIGRCIKCENFVYHDELDNDSLKIFASQGLCIECQEKRKQTLSVDYFIKKFNRINDNLWTTTKYKNKEKLCALGHCGEIKSRKPTNESLVLDHLFNKHGLRVSLINDGKCSKYDQDTPKKRILAALRDIKKIEGENLDI